MTQQDAVMDTDDIESELKRGEDVEYTIKSGDTLYGLERKFNYVNRVLSHVNAERLTSQGRSVHDLKPGDTIVLPGYTHHTHRGKRRAWQEQQVRQEIRLQGDLHEASTGQVMIDDTDWRRVGLHWGRPDKDGATPDFEHTYPFAIIHSVADDDTRELKHRVHLNRFENLERAKPQEHLPHRVKTYAEAHLENEFHGPTREQATQPYLETLSVPDDLMVNFAPAQKATTHPDARDQDPASQAIEKYCAGRIASAVAQTMIAEIELPPNQAIDSESGICNLPNLETWAFLQPPSIGDNPYRQAVHNGWVVDDAQRAGWFRAEILGQEAKKDASTGYYKVPMWVDRIQVSVDDDTGEERALTNVVEQTAWMKVDAQAPNVVYVKFEVVVRNDASKEDFKARRDQLLEDEKYNEVLSLECGSYLKVWVRNLDVDWGDNSSPSDDRSENLRVTMDGLDRLTDSHSHHEYRDQLIDTDLRDWLDGRKKPAYEPRMFRNHTWRRERLVDGEWITQDDGERVELPRDSSDKLAGDLLYVGLYPAELIDALNLFDQPKQPGRPRELNFPVWLGASVFTGVAAFLLGKLIGLMAERRAGKSTATGDEADPAYWEHRYGQAILKSLTNFKVIDLCAILAVDGLRENLNVDEAAGILNELIERLDSLTSMEKLAERLDRINTEGSGEELLADVNDQLKEARKDMKEGLKAVVEAQGDTKKAYDELVQSVRDDINIVKTFEMTRKIYTHLFRFALMDPSNTFVKKEHEQQVRDNDTEALARAIDQDMNDHFGTPVRGMFKRAWGRANKIGQPELRKVIVELKNSLLQGLSQDSIKADTGEIDLIAFQDTRISPPGGRPLPGWLAFLFWSRKVAVKGNLAMKVSAEYDTAEQDQDLSGRGIDQDGDDNESIVVQAGQTFANLLLQLGTGGFDKAPDSQNPATLEIAFQLQAAWTRAVQAFEEEQGKTPSGSTKELKSLNDVRWGAMLKDIFDYLEVSLTVSAQLKVLTNLGWQLTYLFNDDDGGDLHGRLHQLIGSIHIDCPVSARLSVFEWGYQIAHANLAELRREEASFLSDLKLFGEDYWDKGISVSWGDSRFTRSLFRHHQNPTQDVYFGDDIGAILGYSNLELKPDMTAEFSEKGNNSESIIRLESEVFEYEPTAGNISNYPSEIKNHFESDGFTHIASVQTRFSINQAAEVYFNEILSGDSSNKPMVDLSDHTKNGNFLKKLKDKTEFEIQCSILPKAGDWTKRELRNSDTFRLMLPVVRRISAHSHLGNKPYLLYAVRIQNYLREQEFAWVHLVDKDLTSGDDVIRFKARSDQKDYRAWNLMRLERSPLHAPGATNVYHIKIPLELLDKDSLKEAMDLSDSWDETLDLTIELGYYAPIKGDPITFKHDLTEDPSTIKLPYDHAVFQQ